jgi:SAM-dependent methyltransferase
VGRVDPVARTTATYDLVVDDYAARNGTPSPDLLAFQAAFAGALPGQRVVADVGCGPGHHTAWFAARGVRAFGVDRSAGMAARARSAGVPVVRGDLRALPLRDASLDGVWASASLLHVPRPDVPATLREWRRCLRDGGLLGLSTSLGGTEGWEDVPYAAAAPPGDAPLRRWFVHHDRDPLLAAVEAAGFAVRDTAKRVSHRRWLHVLAAAR